MPFVGNVHSEGWRKHLIGRIKSTAYSIDDNGTRYDFDYGWTPWDFFEPALWMGAGSAADYGALGSNGQTYILQTSDFCYPWRVDWRTRSRPSSGGAWTDGADQSLVILPNSTYTVNFTAGADEELQFRDGIICVPT